VKHIGVVFGRRSMRHGRRWVLVGRQGARPELLHELAGI